jgi:hypothetical protein
LFFYSHLFLYYPCFCSRLRQYCLKRATQTHPNRQCPTCHPLLFIQPQIIKIRHLKLLFGLNNSSLVSTKQCPISLISLLIWSCFIFKLSNKMIRPWILSHTHACTK